MRLTALVIVGVAAFASGCGSGVEAAPATTTITVTAPTAPQINTATFVELERLNDKFVARLSAVPDVRSEIMDRRDTGPTEMAHLAHDLCMVMLSKPVDGGPDAALLAAGSYVEATMWIMDEPMSRFTKSTFAQVAAQTFCPDNPAGVR
jgi:hypothetical protein